MPGTILVIGETLDGQTTKLSNEIATLGRGLAEASGLEVVGFLPGDAAAAADLAAHTGGRVVHAAPDERVPAPQAVARVVVDLAREAQYVLVGVTPNGRDLAGILSAVLERPVLSNATGVTWSDGGPVVEMSVFGGKLITRSAFTDGGGIITVRPNAIAAEPAPSAGSVEAAGADGSLDLPAVRVVDQVEEAGAEASLEEAKVVVAGGRGVGGPDGFRVVDELAKELGGVSGATRAAVDSGWIPYARQIGQTGKIVKPQLYLALGVSGAIQHKVGMQGASTIVAVNRDPDAPIAEFADLLVVGDLFEVAPALLEEIRSRRGA
ncbi:MAG TPA: electron transfer flavoprotein subunit alpha/FixB family protein [Candidatus Limnocylindrales bacterium]|nr:electron transfer flavoprotein subunit alpha/FixB family protein [Candidatus Limnocylindrales bacterium]